MKLNVWLAILFLLGCSLHSSDAQGTAFTYQGRLNDGGGLANGTYDLRFSIYDAVTNGNQAAVSVTNLNVAVKQGFFSAILDFGSVFSGSNYWLEIAARTNQATTFITLNPRQAITPAPYAITAANISGNIPISQLPSQIVTNGSTAVSIAGTFFGNGIGLTNVPGTLTPSQNSVLAASVTNGQFNIFYVAPNGTNDMTGVLNQYLMTPYSKVELAPGASYYCTNLVMTNSVFFELNGATIVMRTGATGYLLTTGSNNFNQTIVHGVFQGQNESPYQYTATIPLPLNLPQLYPSTRGSSAGPRSGVHLNAGAGGTFSDNVVRGFNGIGVLVFNWYSTGGVTNSYFSHNTAIMDFIGFAYNSGFDESPLLQYLAETAVIDDCSAYFCGIGCLTGAGNDRIQGCTFNSNFVGIGQNGGGNNAHGVISHCTLNHNTYGIYSASNNGGELIEGCAMYDNLLPSTFHYDFTGIYIIDCHGEPEILAEAGTSLVFNNNGWTPGATSITNVLMTDSNSVIYFNNNRDYWWNDQTSIYGSGMVSNNIVTYSGWSGNGGGLTNLNTYFPSNAWNVSAFTNGMANFSYKIGSSNGQALISVYLSNGVPYIHTLQ